MKPTHLPQNTRAIAHVQTNVVAQGGQPQRSGVTSQHAKQQARGSRGDAEIAEGGG